MMISTQFQIWIHHPQESLIFRPVLVIWHTSAFTLSTETISYKAFRERSSATSSVVLHFSRFHNVFKDALHTMLRIAKFSSNSSLNHWRKNVYFFCQTALSLDFYENHLKKFWFLWQVTKCLEIKCLLFAICRENSNWSFTDLLWFSYFNDSYCRAVLSGLTNKLTKKCCGNVFLLLLLF